MVSTILEKGEDTRIKRGGFNAWLSSLRPKTLTISVTPVLVGTAAAYATTGVFVWWVLLFSLLASLAIHIPVNLFNDSAASVTLSDGAGRLGPLRGVHYGEITTQMLAASALAFLALGWLLSIPLIDRGGTIIAVMLLFSSVMTYLYSHGPSPLCGSVLADPAVFLFFGMLNVPVMCYLQSLSWQPAALLAGIQVGLTTVAINTVNNLRDAKQDALAGRRTIPVVYGASKGRLEHMLSLALPYVLGGLWLLFSMPWAAMLPLLALPLAIKVCRGVCLTEPSRLYNQWLALAALHQIIFGLLLTAGIISGI